jgi:undecaprenyl diphosphate synthase
MSKNNRLPIHVAFIVDGNRRWAKKQGLAEVKGHEKAVEEVIDKIVDYSLKKGIRYLTFWCFSTENWKRGRYFCGFLFKLLEKGIKQRAEEYHKKGIRFKTIGDLSQLPVSLQKMLWEWQEKTRDNQKITVIMAINYGGRDEILRAIARRNFKFQISNFKLNAKEFEKYLDTAGIPDPEMIIRTGGEHRLSGFLLWQAEYSELYFTDVLFPDFNEKELDKALKWYKERQRRFGK